jgi:cardiolipin synthase
MRRQVFAIPNLLTYLRILAVPVFVWAFQMEQYRLALALFVGAAITDGFDGLLARVLHQQTRLGGLLDPVADKLLMLAAVVSLVVHARIPAWVLGIVIFRDICLGAAVIVLRATGRPVYPAPTRLGKYATFAFAVALGLALVRESWPVGGLDGYLAVMLVLAAQCVIASTVQYFARWRRLMHVPPPLT